ncbi:MAG: hypothetical protein IKB93_12090 [Clostridia bacterium]|nr:hypothetical protein [Clostridia bacterium]
MYNIREVFQNGAGGYTPATMWFTQGNINKKEMTYQIEGFKSQGIKDFFIHPSNGTSGDYLGEYFFKMIKHAADEANRLGMNFWIYDEYNWPSGIAAGQVLIEAPWAHSRCLCSKSQSVSPGETVNFSLPEKDLYHTEVLLICADGQEIGAVFDKDLIIWENKSDKAVTLEVYMSKWIIDKNPALQNSEVTEDDAYGCLDTLDKEAVSVFLQKVHEAYKKHIGDGFGKYVKGVFTDEVVTLYDWDMLHGDGDILPIRPWSRNFLEKFKNRNGYDLRPRLKELMDCTDAVLNTDYWETVTDLFMDAYVGMCYDWCTKNNLIFTGHIDCEESIELTVCKDGDPYEYYKRFTYPGIDTIYTYHRINDYSYNIAAKLASSAAHFLGKERVLSETFTLSGWDMRLQDMKRVFNRLAILGVSFIQYMGSRYDFILAENTSSITHNWQNPLFKHYKELSKNISAIQWLISNTDYCAKTLLFYPITTVRATIPPRPFSHKDYNGETDLVINGLVNSLLNLNIPFEIGFEQVIEQATIENGELKIANSCYDTIILPCTTHLKESTFLKLQKFADEGGRIIAVNGKPQIIIGQKTYASPEIENLIYYECREYEKDGEYVWEFDSYQKAPIGEFTQCLKNALGDYGAIAVKINPCDGIMSSVREKDDCQYVMIVNDNDAPTPIRGEVLSDNPFRAINTENGKIRPMHINNRHFEIELCPYECIVLEISPSLEQLPVPPVQERLNITELSVSNIKFTPTDKNTALPDMWHVRGNAVNEIITAVRKGNSKRVCDIAKNLSGSDLIPCRGFPKLSHPDKERKEWFGWAPVDKHPLTPGETVVCVYDFWIDALPESLELVSDPQYQTIWYLNDEQLYQTSSKRVWHYANPVFDISSVVLSGKNRLVSVRKLPEYDNSGFSLPAAVLKGDFRVFEDTILTQKPGTNKIDYWNEQGYMFYTGDGIYSAQFTLSKNENVTLELQTTDVAQVTINGELVGKRIWEPYTFDLTPFVTKGINNLEIRVTSTLSNLLYHSNPSGIKSLRLYTLKRHLQTLL